MRDLPVSLSHATSPSFSKFLGELGVDTTMEQAKERLEVKSKF